MSTDTLPAVAAVVVPENRRLSFLPKYFGRHMLHAEGLLFDNMRQLNSAYDGGDWEYVETSNGAIFAYPRMDGEFKLSWPSNYFEGRGSAQTAGIIATFFTLAAYFGTDISDRVVEIHYALKDYVFTLPDGEVATIMRAID